MSVSVSGHVFFITDFATAFAPVVSNHKQPTDGFKPWEGALVTASYLWKIESFGPITLITQKFTTLEDGSFEFPRPPESSALHKPFAVWITVTGGEVIYRSNIIRFETAVTKPLDIWLYPDIVNTKDGISAGTVSSELGNSQLPGNTKITSGGPLQFKGSKGQANINFTISVVPDVSPIQDHFLDLALSNSNISVGWPTSWFYPKSEILDEIRSGIANAGSAVNQAVLTQMTTIIMAEEKVLTEPLVHDFLNNEVVTTLFALSYPGNHTWSINDKTDPTIVLIVNPCIGFPRTF